MRSVARWPSNPRTARKTDHGPLWNRVLLVVDHPRSNPGLIQFVHGKRAVELCSVRADSELALKKIAALKPDLVVVDIALIGRGGLDLFGKIKEKHPDQSVVMLSMSPTGGPDA